MPQSDLIWKWFDSDYRAHVTAKQYKVLIRWDGVVHGSTYTYPDKPKEYDIQFSSELLSRVIRTLKSMSKPTNPAKGRNDLGVAK